MKKSIILFCGILLLTIATANAYDETYEKAVKHFKGGEYKRAIPHLETYAHQKPDPAVYYMLGYSYYQLKDFERSKYYFDQAYLLDPDFTSDKVPAHAGISNDEQGLIHEALDLSGAKLQMEQYADNLSKTLPQLRSGMSDRKQKDDILLYLRDSYKLNKIYPPVVETFRARFNKQYMLSAIRWLKSPLGKKSTGLEVAANLQEMMHEATAFRMSMTACRKAARQRIRDLEKGVRATELNVDIAAVSLFEMLKGMQTGMQGSGKMNSDQIDVLVAM